MKPSLITLLLVILPLSLFARDDQKNYSEAFHIIEVWLDAQRDFDMLPGISASVTEGQELIWSGAFGFANVENTIETTPATLGSICSISKLFTSVAVMKLYDEGKLRLDDRIEDLLPWYDLEQRYTDSGPITVRALLTHSAGLQLRLLDSDTSEILKPSTLRYMQNVHFTDSDWETTWGLGFVVSKGSDGSKWVSHGGYCPGYQSLWNLNPKSERAYSVIINSNGVNPGKYSNGMHGILAEVTSKSATSEAVRDSLNLSDFTGYYQINDSESYLSSWEGKLVSIGLPNQSPADNMTMFRYLEGDTFVRIRKDDSDGETIEFERDENGDVIRYKRHQIYFTKTASYIYHKTE